MMAKLERKLQKVFGETAGDTGKTTFGSIATTGEAQFSNDVEEIQTDAYSSGWRSAIKMVEGRAKAPIVTDMNSVNYVSSYQIKYLFQEGTPEWLSTETYYAGSKVKVWHNGTYEEYVSLQDDNIGHEPTVSPTFWKIFVSGVADWKDNITYSVCDKVRVKSGNYYREYYSLIDDNLNNNPTDVNSTAWVLLGVGVWKAPATYNTNDLVINSDRLYRSKIDHNTNKEPKSNLAQWERLNRPIQGYDNTSMYMYHELVARTLDNNYYVFRCKADGTINIIPNQGIKNDTNWDRVLPQPLLVYDADKTYCQDEKCYSLQGTNYYEYISLVNNNKGHTPPNSVGDAYWRRCIPQITSNPDYGNARQIAVSTTITAPENGLFIIAINMQQADVQSSISYNNNRYNIVGNAIGTLHNDTWWILVSSGDVFTINAPSGISSIIFVPFK